LILSIARLGVGRHLSPHFSRRQQGVPIGRQPGRLGQALAFLCVIKKIFVRHVAKAFEQARSRIERE